MATIYNTALLKEYFSRLNVLKHPLRRESAPKESPLGTAIREPRFSVLAEGTVISGSLHSPTDLTVLGQVNGDIFSEGNVEVRGEVTGNLTACNVRIFGGRVQGNIQAQDHCQVLQGILEGDLEAFICEIDGTVEGNILARESINIHRNSVIRGDISTRILQIEGEAKLSGRVQMEAAYTETPAEAIPLETALG